MTIAPCRALARFRHRRKIAAMKSLPPVYDRRQHPDMAIGINGGEMRRVIGGADRITTGGIRSSSRLRPASGVTL